MIFPEPALRQQIIQRRPRCFIRQFGQSAHVMRCLQFAPQPLILRFVKCDVSIQQFLEQGWSLRDRRELLLFWPGSPCLLALFCKTKAFGFRVHSFKHCNYKVEEIIRVAPFQSTSMRSIIAVVFNTG
jgi:hypothetical protein